MFPVEKASVRMSAPVGRLLEFSRTKRRTWIAGGHELDEIRV
jgi:hypothetical protein